MTHLESMPPGRVFASAPDGELDRSPKPPTWIETRPGLPYFATAGGESWTPIGQNDAIGWLQLDGLFRRRDPASAEAYLRTLKANGVTVLRLMLEYAHDDERYIEDPVGHFVPDMVRLWDDLFALCEEIGLHLLITPVDTFFMWRRWDRHPYNAKNGGPCHDQREWLLSPGMRAAIKNRLAFASDRWGASAVLFAWDLWNEIHPAHAGFDRLPDGSAVGDASATFREFIADVGSWLRAFEVARHGRAHPQTVSIFGPELVEHPELDDPIFRHPDLDFASPHLYEKDTIDDPRDTVAPALAVGRLVRRWVAEACDGRPVMDSEHGPIYRFLNKRHTLPAAFDDEYFRHMQWAHLASGGAGGGMRWPNRHPHMLTDGMRSAQRALARFVPLIDWTRFHRRNLNEEIGVSSPRVERFGCGDDEQALVWLLRNDAVGADGRLARAASIEVEASVPGLVDGRYRYTLFDTRAGESIAEGRTHGTSGGPLRIAVPELSGDLAIAIRRTAD